MIHIRKATEKDCVAIAKIRIDNWKTTYKGLLPQSFLDDLDYEKETNYWLNYPRNKYSNVFVATNSNNDILGFVGIKSFDDEKTIGEIYALHTSQRFRGQGAGKALIHHSAQFFKANGMNEMHLWVVKGNDNATAIYAYLGAKTYTERIEIINDTDVPEIGMKWNSLDDFLVKIASNYLAIIPENTFIVYGSLAPNAPNHSKISHIKGEWYKGFIYGKLESSGWGAAMGYNGFRPTNSESQQKIPAYILVSNELAHHWRTLDAFEGDEYERILTKFELENGVEGIGNIYALK